MFLQKENAVWHVSPESYGIIPLALVFNKFQIAQPGLCIESGKAGNQQGKN
jgi:hypothetical protein